MESLIDISIEIHTQVPQSKTSLVYTHKGAPLILSSIRSRILLPNRSVPSNIGEDNTIFFLQVIKAQQPQQPPSPPKK